MTYVLLIYALRGQEALAAEEEARVIDAHRGLQADSNKRGQLHAVARLAASPGAKVVHNRGASYEITDGPYMESKEWLVGFYLVDCDDEAQALERAKQICPTGAHAIEVRPVQWRWQPDEA